VSRFAKRYSAPRSFRTKNSVACAGWLTEGSLKLVSSNAEQEEAQEELDVKYSGDALDIGLNVIICSIAEQRPGHCDGMRVRRFIVERAHQLTHRAGFQVCGDADVI